MAVVPPSVNAVLLRYLEFAAEYYQKNGKPTGEIDNIRHAVVPLKKLYGRTPAQEFGPKHLELVRQAMIDADLARTTINGRIGKIKRLFRWATKEGLVPASTWHGLSTVDGLKRGRSKAREAKRICCVPDEHVRLTCAMVNDHVRAMIQVQELAGMRSQDIYNLRTGDLDMSGDVWIYTTWTHKNEHHGHDRKIAIGPRAQAILRPFLKIGEPTAFVFTPMEAVRSVRQKRALARKTKTPPSQLKREKKANPTRVPAAREKHAEQAARQGGSAPESRRPGVLHSPPGLFRALKSRLLGGRRGARSKKGLATTSVFIAVADVPISMLIPARRRSLVFTNRRSRAAAKSV